MAAAVVSGVLPPVVAVLVAVAGLAALWRWGVAGLWDALTEVVHSVCRRLAHGRPHRVDNPVQNEALPPAWGTFAAALERVPAGVRAEFLPPAERVDLPPRAASVTVRFRSGGYVSPGQPVTVLPRVPTGPAPGGRRPPRIRPVRGNVRAAPRPEPTVGPVGGSGCSDAWRPADFED